MFSKKIYPILVAALFVACDDDSGSNAGNPIGIGDHCEGVNYDAKTQVCDSRDGQVYRIVTIGSQTWMAENLNYYNKDDATLNGRSWVYNSEDDDKIDWYFGESDRFYAWAAAVGRAEKDCGYGNVCNLGKGVIQGICPDGWHLPTYDEWGTLFTNVGGQDNAGKTLRAKTGWSEGVVGTDAYGFSVMPSPFWDGQGWFGGLGGNDAIFWSASENGSEEANAVDFHPPRYEGGVRLYPYEKSNGFSVRCLKD